jgi:hypothetical protein
MDPFQQVANNGVNVRFVMEPKAHALTRFYKKTCAVVGALASVTASMQGVPTPGFRAPAHLVMGRSMDG